ncbi:MAG: RluA family pseudouridine synthase [bacterium]
MEKHTYKSLVEDENKRLDFFLAQKEISFSRSYIQKMIKNGLVSVNNLKILKPNYKIKNNNEIVIEISDQSFYIKPENISLNIIYEDDELLVINKKRGQITHPTSSNLEGTLVNALLAYCNENLSSIGGIFRPGIVHRLDKNTSGLMLVAKNNSSHLWLKEQLQYHKVKREYIAVVYGNIEKNQNIINAPIGRNLKNFKKMAVTMINSKKAITYIDVIERFNNRFTLIKANLETGRTHQIRVHLSYIGYPIVGDVLYGPKKQLVDFVGQALHSQTIEFIHPKTKEKMMFSTPISDDIQELIDRIKKI